MNAKRQASSQADGELVRQPFDTGPLTLLVQDLILNGASAFELVKDDMKREVAAANARAEQQALRIEQLRVEHDRVLMDFIVRRLVTQFSRMMEEAARNEKTYLEVMSLLYGKIVRSGDELTDHIVGIWPAVGGRSEETDKQFHHDNGSYEFDVLLPCWAGGRNDHIHRYHEYMGHPWHGGGGHAHWESPNELHTTSECLFLGGFSKENGVFRGDHTFLRGMPKQLFSFLQQVGFPVELIHVSRNASTQNKKMSKTCCGHKSDYACTVSIVIPVEKILRQGGIAPSVLARL